jgi:hypothetical protein
MVQDFVAYPSKLRLFGALIGCLAFILAGLWMAGVVGPPIDEDGSAWIGWLGVAFFGFCLIFIAKAFFDTDVQVRIDQRGIYAKRWSEHTIPWSDITHVGVWEFKRQKMIILSLKDPARFPAAGLQGLLAGANNALSGGDIAISLSGTDGRFDDAMAAIERYRG